MGAGRARTFSHVPFQRVGPTQLPAFYMPFKTKHNPNLDTARTYSKEFAARTGMLSTLPGGIGVWDPERFDAMDLAYCGHMIDPHSDTDGLNMTACWLTWGTYGDDYFPVVFTRIGDLAGAKVFVARQVASASNSALSGLRARVHSSAAMEAVRSRDTRFGPTLSRRARASAASRPSGLEASSSHAARAVSGASALRSVEGGVMSCSA